MCMLTFDNMIDADLRLSLLGYQQTQCCLQNWPFFSDFSYCWILCHYLDNLLRQRRNRCHFADIFKCIFLNENVWISIDVPLKFVPKGPINNIPALVQIMAWHRLGDKPLSQCIRKTFMVHQTIVRWALYILLKFMKALIRHLALAVGNVRRFSWTLLSATSHYLNQWWLFYWHIYASLSLNEITNIKMAD